MQSEFPESEARHRSLTTCQHNTRSLRRLWSRQLSHMPVPHDISEIPLGPAVVPEPWTPAPRIPDAENPVSPTSALRPLAPRPSVSGAPRPSGPAAPSPVPTVSRLAEASTYPTTRSASSSRTVAVGPAIPRSSAPATFAESPPAVATSFSSMSAPHRAVKPDRRPRTGSPVSNCSRPVNQVHQQQNPPPTQLRRPHRQPRSSGAPPPAAGTKSTELDELARRLYEPLTARLRAELWLDRERAGVMTDG